MRQKSIIINNDILKNGRVEMADSQVINDLYKKIPVPTYIWRAGSQGIVLIDYNDAALRYSGPKLHRLKHKTANEIYSDVPFVIDAMEECRSKKKSVNREIVIPLRTTGEERCLDCTWTWIDPDLIIFHAHDHTAIKNATLLLESMVEQKTRELQTALEEIKVLKGLLPICMHCKGIRNEEGVWKKLEEYIAEHSDVQFTHGICNQCMQKHYPDLTRKKS